jgi:hypothetical protein
MDEKEWELKISQNCDNIVIVHGGCNCRKSNGITDYCSFERCPKISHRVLYTCGGCSKKCILTAVLEVDEVMKNHLICVDSRSINEDDVRQEVIDNAKSVWV